MKDIGYKVVDSETFEKNEKHLIVIGSTESVILSNAISFFNWGTPEFDLHAASLHKGLELGKCGKSLLFNRDKIQSQNKTSRGQPIILNMSYSIQNCLDATTIPGMYLPKLTTKGLNGITYINGCPIAHCLIEMMSDATKFLQQYQQSTSKDLPFQNRHCNELFGNRIGTHVNHPFLDKVCNNSFEGITTGVKTQEQSGFGTHVDGHNSFSDPTYNETIVACEVVDVPANGSIPFGNGEKMFPFSIFFNRRGCETRCEYEKKAMNGYRTWKNITTICP
jgi:hypothetical protein